MTVEQLIQNIKEIQATSPGPYYIGRGLALSLQNSCRFSKAAVNANREETAYFGVAPELDEVSFTVMSNSDLNNFLVFVAGEDGQVAEVEAK